MSLVVATEPTSLVAVEDQCLRVEMWAESATSIPELRDAGDDWWTPNRLGNVALIVGTLALVYATDYDYWHGVALSFGVAMTALAVVLWWEDES